ncbi:hypothetical protein [Piscinibacter koreensis]|uniref:DUF4129 domain-containing protein n=1 Tax=Piscinibacter koreensis TaxID=2742824 RepID=A0A7Y6NLJ2_9BURK|nr:hypothetical protein [Schlegelella koreensis]NUZ05425.1 hypothetical protein [Schlegelella koreensis]
MRVDAIAIDLRPRSMMEASDLGVRLVGANLRSVVRTGAPVAAVTLLLALSTIELAPWLPSLLLFWFKPWLDRTLLFVLARAVFGQPTTFTDLWNARREVWWSQLLPTLTRRRFSPWRSYVAPVHQLEGQRGAESRRRRDLILHGRRGVAFAMQWAFGWVELALLLGLTAFAFWFAPPERGGAWFMALFGEGRLESALTFAAYALAVCIAEPFFVGAGFAMYLNRRVELEAWDIEQEFRLAFAA